jgi:hypothetical protein
LVGDDVSEGDDHIRGLKTVLLTDFPNINAAVNCTPAELNYNDITTLGTAAASKTLTASAGGIADTTGITVLATTQSPADNSTKVATTAYADAIGAFVTSSHSFGSLDADEDSATWDWTHGLGVDDVDFGFSVLGSTISSATIAVGRDVGGYFVSMVGGSATDDAGVGGNPDAPASGELAFRVKNSFSGAQTITIKVWARAR